MKKFDEKELALYDGQNGKPIYITYKGKVYDVSNSFLWKDGEHQVIHRAGMDLTAFFQHAPHGEKVLKRFSVVGFLRKK